MVEEFDADKTVEAAPPITLAKSAATKESVREFLLMSGSMDGAVDQLRDALPMLKNAEPDLPAEYWDEFIAVAEPSDLLELIVPIYQERYTEEEIRLGIAFFSSDVGRKMAENRVIVKQQILAATEKWVLLVADLAMSKLQQKAGTQSGESAVAAEPLTIPSSEGPSVPPKQLN